MTGDAVNTAARLEQAAPTGAVLIGEPTYRMVMDAIEVEPVGSITAKRQGKPWAAYQLLSVMPESAPPEPQGRRHLAPGGSRGRTARARESALAQATDRPSMRARGTVLGSPGASASRASCMSSSARSTEQPDPARSLPPVRRGASRVWPIAESVRRAADIAERRAPSRGGGGTRSRRCFLIAKSEARSGGDRLAAAVGLGEAAPLERSRRHFGRSASSSRPSPSIAHWSWSSRTSIGPSQPSWTCCSR